MVRAGLIVLALAALAPVAQADDKPWAAGVSDESKAAAKVLLDAGNAKLVEHDYLGALEIYKQAIEKWDHPAIRFNMVRCLIQLDRPLEASENLTLALKYGADPLEEVVYNEALNYQKLLASQVGAVTVRCTQPGVTVQLDGDALVTCPGQERRRVRAGKHQLVGAGTGMLTKSAQVFVTGGTEETTSVELAAIERSGTVVHRWSTWMPWLVLGAGLTVTGVGGLIEYQSYQTMDEYDRALVAACFDTGCDEGHPLPADIAATKDRAKLQNRIAVTTIAAGVTTVVAGGVLLYLNRARVVYPVAEHVDVTPTAGGAAVSLRGRF